MIIGRLDRPARPEPPPLQFRVPASLRGDAAQRRDRAAATTAARTGSVSATTVPPTQRRRKRRSTAARGYFDVPFYLNQGSWTMTPTSKLLIEAGYTAFRYNPIFGASAAGRHHQPDSGAQSSRTPSTPPPGCGMRRCELRLPGYPAMRMGGRQDRRLAGSGVLRDRRAQREVRLPGQPAGPARSDDRERYAGFPIASTRACRMPSVTGYPTWGVERSRACTACFPGHLDVGPPDAAGCTALRPGVELRARRG